MSTLHILIIALLGICLTVLDVVAKKKTSPNKVARIVGGTTAARDEYPWQILLKHGNRFICGGSIIGNQTILTAAHCVYFDVRQRKQPFVVYAGKYKANIDEPSEQISAVSRVVMHPKFKLASLIHDIAILQLTDSLNFTNSVKPVQLSDAKFDVAAVSNKRCFVSGYGVYKESPLMLPTTLQKAKITVINNKRCNKKMKRLKEAVTRRMLCTYDQTKGLCFGDSGGPLGCYDKKGSFRQIGIISWGAAKSCLEGPGVHTRVSKYLNWINRASN